ncbi:unnamed protein product, partial [Didymodactylos carnosus]
RVLCQIWLSIDFSASTASIFNLLTLSLDRYWSIISPLQYLGKRTQTRALFMIGFAWGLSILWIIPVIGWHKFTNEGIRDVHDNQCEPEYTRSKVFKVTTAIINFYLPLVVMMLLNGRIYYEIKRRYKNALLNNNSYTKRSVNANGVHNRYNSDRGGGNIEITRCSDSDRQLCTKNLTENDSLTKANPKIIPMKKRYQSTNARNSNIDSDMSDNSILRINFKEKRNLLLMLKQKPPSLASTRTITTTAAIIKPIKYSTRQYPTIDQIATV